MTDSKPESLTFLFAGIAAFLFYAIHGGFHVLNGRVEDLLWGCTLSSLLIGTGVILRAPTWNAVGVLWLCYGLPMWLFDVATGGEFFPTSILIHVGSLGVGLWGVKRLRMPRGTWWRAGLLMLLLVGLCRLVTPPAANVNLSHSVQVGWEKTFPSFGPFLALSLVGATSGFWVFERLICWRLDDEEPDRQVVPLDSPA